ncbi:hypothetical protein WOLCODRAFT_155180 [Wolfiporia cocos MD-104 SS10]|uniref:Uncharacterized protein n=1 Tax=Wolfiporia cocos (strain MD-104) TaxID=742152 RepID=A0A2H3JEW0_WOLCO|nr:hypothetical protein WOLCODRAFT_155180 [Wolfiporia cocos MD-104 SS10]
MLPDTEQTELAVLTGYPFPACHAGSQSQTLSWPAHLALQGEDVAPLARLKELETNGVFNNKGAKLREAVEEIICVKLAPYASGGIRPHRAVYVQASQQRGAHAAREAGRERASGLTAAHTLLDRRGTVHPGLHRMRHSGVVRERQAAAARYACG